MLTTEKPIKEIIEENKTSLQTPYFLIDETRLLKNLERINIVRQQTGAKMLLALKCFSTWSVFELMKKFMDGTTSSSPYEAKLGHEKFGGVVHAYSVAFSKDEIEDIRDYATEVIFNSTSQLKAFAPLLKEIPIGLRINPGISHSSFDLANPARRYCRLGANDIEDINSVADMISGAMFHCNCENNSLESFSKILDHIGNTYENLLYKLKWVSLGGGLYFTQDGYPLEEFCDIIAAWAKKYDVQLFFEPGETSITQSAYLVTQVLDIVHNEMDTAIVDAAVECHMPDLLIYQTPGKTELAQNGPYPTIVAGRTCLAGDVFGTYNFMEKPETGTLIPFSDAAGYTMVKKNWFNGVKMPSIVVRRLDGRIDVVRKFSYEDFRDNLS